MARPNLTPEQELEARTWAAADYRARRSGIDNDDRRVASWAEERLTELPAEHAAPSEVVSLSLLTATKHAVTARKEAARLIHGYNTDYAAGHSPGRDRASAAEEAMSSADTAERIALGAGVAWGSTSLAAVQVSGASYADLTLPLSNNPAERTAQWAVLAAYALTVRALGFDVAIHGFASAIHGSAVSDCEYKFGYEPTHVVAL